VRKHCHVTSHEIPHRECATITLNTPELQIEHRLITTDTMHKESSTNDETSEVKLDFVRETGDNANWLNRFVQDAETKVRNLSIFELTF